MKWILLLIGLCMLPFVSATITIYNDNPPPVVNLTLGAGTTFAENTTYFFQCVYIKDYRGYYSNGCYGDVAEEVNITTNSTHRNISMQWGYINSSGSYVVGYPYPMNNIICRWDVQSFKPDGTNYFTYGRTSNESGYHQNWTTTNNYGGLNTWTGNNRTLLSTDLRSGGVYATVLGIPYFSQKLTDANNENFTFGPLTQTNQSSACVLVTSTNTGNTLFTAVKANNVSNNFKLVYHQNLGLLAGVMRGTFFSQTGGSLTLSAGSDLITYNHGISSSLGNNFTLILTDSSYEQIDDISGASYNDIRINATNSRIYLPVDAISMAGFWSGGNVMFSGMTLPTSYIIGSSNWVYTKMKNHNNRYPTIAAHITENNTYVRTAEYITPESATTCMNKTFNFTNLYFNNFNNSWTTDYVAYDIYMDNSAITSTYNNWYWNGDFYNTISNRNPDNKPVVYFSATGTGTPVVYQNITFINDLKIRLVNSSGSAMASYNVSATNNANAVVQGVTDANGTTILKVREYQAQFNTSVATTKAMYFNLTPVYVNISYNGTQLYGFYYYQYGQKDWTLPTDSPFWVSAINWLFGRIILSPDGRGIVSTG